jgi:4-hydroxybenzoate decarboxylase
MMYCTVVKIDKQYEGHPKEVMARTFEANPNYTFVCIVVDKDVNIHDFKSVFCAYLTRGRVDRRIMVLADVPCWDRASDPTYAGRIGIDATMQLGREKDFERAITPGADSLDLTRYLAPARAPT